ncbi:MAG TPA: ATP-binding cassette domain-containing protein [Patescibacteria group bacterium]|nr:ATP-binding cassette domain-containing protein [Patescibacteria group bacterium]
MSTISVQHLSKTFEYYKKPEGLKGSITSLFHRVKLTKEAVKDISFEVEQGEFLGFIGPNGAGKTTTLKMLSGILTPTQGTLSVLGFNPTQRKDDFKKKISLLMGQKSALWMTLPAMETLRLLQRIYEISEGIFQKRLKEFSRLLDVQDLLQVQVRKLSLGQRMKCELMAALLHGPKVLFLDEPTIGLDIVSQKKIREFLQEYNRKEKVTILLTSHSMADIENLCGRIVVINEGQIVLDDTLKAVLRTFGSRKVVTVSFSEEVSRKDVSRLGQILRREPFEAEISMPADKLKERIALLVSAFPVRDFSIQDVALEEIIVGLFQKG